MRLAQPVSLKPAPKSSMRSSPAPDEHLGNHRADDADPILDDVLRDDAAARTAASEPQRWWPLRGAPARRCPRPAAPPRPRGQRGPARRCARARAPAPAPRARAQWPARVAGDPRLRHGGSHTAAARSPPMRPPSASARRKGRLAASAVRRCGRRRRSTGGMGGGTALPALPAARRWRLAWAAARRGHRCGATRPRAARHRCAPPPKPRSASRVAAASGDAAAAVSWRRPRRAAPHQAWRGCSGGAVLLAVEVHAVGPTLQATAVAQHPLRASIAEASGGSAPAAPQRKALPEALQLPLHLRGLRLRVRGRRGARATAARRAAPEARAGGRGGRAGADAAAPQLLVEAHGDEVHLLQAPHLPAAALGLGSVVGGPRGGQPEHARAAPRRRPRGAHRPATGGSAAGSCAAGGGSLRSRDGSGGVPEQDTEQDTEHSTEQPTELSMETFEGLGGYLAIPGLVHTSRSLTRAQGLGGTPPLRWPRKGDAKGFQGRAKTCQGLPRSSKGLPRPSKGLQRPSQGHPRTSPGLPSHSKGVSGASSDAEGASRDLPRASKRTPRVSKGAPEHSKTCHGLPGAHQDLPRPSTTFQEAGTAPHLVVNQ